LSLVTCSTPWRPKINPACDSDLSAAFDCCSIDQRTLISRLDYAYGITGVTIDQLKSDLDSHVSFVRCTSFYRTPPPSTLEQYRWLIAGCSLRRRRHWNSTDGISLAAHCALSCFQCALIHCDLWSVHLSAASSIDWRHSALYFKLKKQHRRKREGSRTV